MSITFLPSGRYRAQVWDALRSRNVSAGLVLDERGTYATRAEAEHARDRAREVLRARDDREFTRTPRLPWRVWSKGEEGCRTCGENATHLHHIIPRALSSEAARDIDRNGMPLCGICHRRWHSRAENVPHEAMTDEEFAFVCSQMGAGWVDRHYPGATADAEARQRDLVAA